MTAQDLANSIIPMENFFTINETDSVQDALSLMRQSFHKGSAWQGPHLLIVINNQNQPVGLLTLQCLLQATKLKQLTADNSFKSQYVSWYFIKKCCHSGIAIREIMRPLDVHSIDCRDFDMKAAAAIFSRKNINYLPVLDKRKLIGIVDKSSIFYELQTFPNFLPEKAAAFKSPANYFKNTLTNLAIFFTTIFSVRVKKISR